MEEGYKLKTRNPRKILYDKEGEPYIVYRCKNYYLNEVMRVHNNPWIQDVFPEYIHGLMTYNAYGSNLYIQIKNEEVYVWEK